MCGWLGGILLSPLGSQRQRVSHLATAIPAFWSGVVVSHLGAIRGALVHVSQGSHTMADKLRLLYVLTVFLFAFTGTFNSRFDDSQIGIDVVGKSQ
jgi:hypothetical protein